MALGGNRDFRMTNGHQVLLGECSRSGVGRWQIQHSVTMRLRLYASSVIKLNYMAAITKRTYQESCIEAETHILKPVVHCQEIVTTYLPYCHQIFPN